MLFTLPKKRFLFYFCSDFFGHVGKWFDKKAKVDFKIYDVTNWETNNCNTHIVQDLKKQRQQIKTIKFDQLIEYNITNLFREKS